ncbi:hypothetical protein F5X99DRAFT_389209 [Biscogniauxia marginata]|nr:hypothetical protein F5X99DRAFT_389209 [Biscogniauxia marginata]
MITPAPTHHLAYPPRPSKDQAEEPRQVLIFFVPGNPGLIDYYEPFLSALRGLLDASPPLRRPARFHVYGQDLAGFSDDHHEPFTSSRKPHDLEYQIRHSLEALRSLRIESDGPGAGRSYDEVLLVGHSVGAYIALELCHRVLKDPGLAPGLNINSGILLFPTIHHISRSPSGWKLDLLRRTPVLGDNAYRVAQGFLHLWPRGALYWLVHRVLRFPPGPAEVTTRWLKSRDGVWQALHMGMDEMQVIGEDRWDDELWEIDHEAQARRDEVPAPTPKFYFFFGRHDHWVANHYRDDFIRERQKHVERTRLIVDESDIPHAFCINHSETVAEKVHVWINEMYGAE